MNRYRLRSGCRSASQPKPIRLTRPSTEQAAKRSPAAPGETPEDTAESTRKTPVEVAAAEPRNPPRVRTTRPPRAGPCRRAALGRAGGSAGVAAGDLRPDQQGDRERHRGGHGPAPAEHQRDARHGQPAQQGRRRDGRLLDAERHPQALLGHELRDAEVGRRLGDRVAQAADRQAGHQPHRRLREPDRGQREDRQDRGERRPLPGTETLHQPAPGRANSPETPNSVAAAKPNIPRPTSRSARICTASAPVRNAGSTPRTETATAWRTALIVTARGGRRRPPGQPRTGTPRGRPTCSPRAARARCVSASRCTPSAAAAPARPPTAVRGCAPAARRRPGRGPAAR